DGAVKPGALKDFLAGTWLGHPLHPVLTDLPIGFWSSSFALDVFGGRESERASEILLGLGVLSALPTAASGLTDWTDTGGAARRRWTALLDAAALSDGKPVKAETGAADVLLYKSGADVFAISDTCSHRGCSLADGDVRDGVVECACHGSAFRLSDGEIVRGPA